MCLLRGRRSSAHISGQMLRSLSGSQGLAVPLVEQRDGGPDAIVAVAASPRSSFAASPPLDRFADGG